MKYPQYESYKESGIDWLGQVPESWIVKKIKWDTAVFRGASPRPIDDPVYFDDDGDYAWVRIADVTASDKYLEKTTQRLSALGASFSVKMQPKSLFLSIAGSVGKPCITNIKCCIHDGFVYFPFLKINQDFLYYIFASGESYKGLGKLGTQLNLNTETVGSISIAIPTSIEQQSIANFLDKETTRLDALIAKKQQLIETLKEKRIAVISQAVTKGLNPDASMKDSGIEWINEVPIQWNVKKLKYVAQLKSGDSITSEEFDDDGKYPVFGGNGIRGYYSKYTHDGNFVLIGRQGALCGNINYASGKFWASEHAVVASIYKEDNFYWLGELLRLMNLNQYSISAAQPGLAVERIKNLFIPVPPSSEQTEISNFLKIENEKFDYLINKTSEAISKLQEYKTALISAAVTGKIKVPEQA